MAFELGLVLLLLFFPQLVAAETTPAEREIARSAMQSGDQRHDAGDLQGALQRYRSAHAIMHVPTTGLAVARTEAELSLLVEARSTAMEVLNLPGAEQESTIFAKARADAAALAAKLEPLVPSISVEVTPTQLDYTITLDGDTLPGAANSCTLKTDPGQHVVEISAAGFYSQSHELTLKETETYRLSVQLQPVPAPVVTLPSTPSPPKAAPPILRPQPAPRTPKHPGQTRALIALTTGGVLLLGGGAAGVASLIKTARIEPHCDAGYCGMRNRSALSTANTLANVANIALPLGVLSVGYAIYEFLSLDQKAASHDQAYWLRPDSVGVHF